MLISFTRPPATLRLAGEIDESNYADLTSVLGTAAAAGDRALLVDMADVAYCDLAGLRAIISLTGARTAGQPAPQQVILRDVPEASRTLLDILGWDTTPGLCLDRSRR